MIEGAGVDNRLRVTLATQHDHQIGHHRCTPLVVELDDIFLRQRCERHLDHPDGAFDQRLASRNNCLRLLSAKHRAGDLGRISEIGETALVDRDARDV